MIKCQIFIPTKYFIRYESKVKKTINAQPDDLNAQRYELLDYWNQIYILIRCTRKLDRTQPNSTPLSYAQLKILIQSKWHIVSTRPSNATLTINKRKRGFTC